jgi:hypothetical protein
MSEPTEQGGTPPPEPPNDFAAQDAREELFTGTLRHSNRMVNAAEAVRLHLMLVGFEAMLREEEEQTGSMPRPDDPVVRGFFMHQADELRTTLFDIEHRLMAARMLRDHLPRTWAVFLGGLASERAVVVAASEAVGLEGDDQFEAFDAKAAELVPEERPSAVKRELKDLRETLNPDATTARHKAASNRRFVRARQEDDGMAVLEIHSTEADIAAAYDRIRKNAVAAHGREGECRALGALMVDGAIDAILSGRMRGPEEGGPSFPMERLGETDDPSRKLIDATILVIVSADTATGASDVPGEIAGMGRIDAETARAIVAHTRTWTRVVVDPVDDAVLAIDSSERYIPAGLKKLLHLRQPTCGCGCGLPAHRADIDHVQRFEHDGRTRHDNLQILCRKSHQGKDAGFADVTLEPDGRWKWSNKWGGMRFVTPTVKLRTATYPDEAPF